MNQKFVVLFLVACFARHSYAEIVYDLEALPGSLAGTNISGRIVLPDSSAGTTVWDIDSTAIDFYFETDFNGGQVFEFIFDSRLIQFDNGIGAPVLTAVLPDVAPGFPDWGFQQHAGVTLPGDYVLGLGVDAGGTVIWNLVEADVGVQDFHDTQSGSAVPAWRLVRVPEPSGTILVGMVVLLVGLPTHRSKRTSPSCGCVDLRFRLFARAG